MRHYEEITERLASELKFLDEEGKQPLEIAELSLKTAMCYTITKAPTTLMGIQLICKAFNDVMWGVVTESLTKEK